MTDYLEELVRKAEEFLEEGGDSAFSLLREKMRLWKKEHQEEAQGKLWKEGREAEKGAAFLSAAGTNGRTAAERNRGENNRAGKSRDENGWDEDSREDMFFSEEGKKLPALWKSGTGDMPEHTPMRPPKDSAVQAGTMRAGEEADGMRQISRWAEDEGKQWMFFLPEQARAARMARDFHHEGSTRPGEGWNERDRDGRQAAEYRAEVETAAQGEGQTALEVDRQFQRDARRYDGAFSLH